MELHSFKYFVWNSTLSNTWITFHASRYTPFPRKWILCHLSLSIFIFIYELIHKLTHFKSLSRIYAKLLLSSPKIIRFIIHYLKNNFLRLCIIIIITLNNLIITKHSLKCDITKFIKYLSH